MKSSSLVIIAIIFIVNLCSTIALAGTEDNREITEKMRKVLIDQWCGFRKDNDGTIQRWAVLRFFDGTYRIQFFSQDPAGKTKEWGELGRWEFVTRYILLLQQGL